MSTYVNKLVSLSFFSPRWLAWMALPFLVACSLEETGFFNPDPDAMATIVAEQGGTVTAKDGTSVIIPPGAIAEDADVTTQEEEPDALVSLPFARTLAGTATAFTPTNLTFSESATIRLPYNGNVPSDELAVHGLDDTNDDTWSEVPGVTYDDGIAEFQTRRFGIFAVTRRAQESVGNLGSNVRVRYDYNEIAQVPLWIGYRDGEGPWSRLDPAGESTSFAAKSGRYEIAWACPDGNLRVRLLAATVQELGTAYIHCADRGSTNRRKLDVRATLADESNMLVLYHGSSTVFVQDLAGSFYAQPLDLIAQEHQENDTGARLTRMQIIRDFDSSAGDVSSIDVNLATNGKAPVPRTVGYGGGAMSHDGSIWLRTRSGTTAWLGDDGSFGEPPSSDRVSGDQILVHSTAQAQNSRTYRRELVDPGSDVEIELGPVYAGGEVQPTTGTQFDMFRWTPNDDARLYVVDEWPWQIIATPGFLGSEMAYVIPDMGEAPNWEEEFGKVGISVEFRSTVELGIVAGGIPSETQVSQETLALLAAESITRESLPKTFARTAPLPTGFVVHFAREAVPAP